MEVTLKAAISSLTRILSQPKVYEILDRSEIRAAMAVEEVGRDLLGGGFDPDFLLQPSESVTILERCRFESYCFYRVETRL